MTTEDVRRGLFPFDGVALAISREKIGKTDGAGGALGFKIRSLGGPAQIFEFSLEIV